jgi:hypothetical protein
VDALYLKLMGPHAMGDANHVCTQA